MNKLIYILISSVMVFILGCSSGGDGGAAPPVENGGGESGITYTGPRSQATIIEDNACDLAVGAWDGWRSSTTAPVLSLEVPDGDKSTLSMLEDLAGLVNQMELEPSTSVNAIHTNTETFYGSCGGSVDGVANIDDETGDVWGTLDCYDYCESGMTMSGHVDFTGYIDPTTGETEWITIVFAELDVDFFGESITLAGTCTYYFVPGSDRIVCNVYIRDNATGEVFWVEDYEMISAGMTYEIEGTYYDPNYGYVSMRTSEPFQVSDGWPSDGILSVEGESGTNADMEMLGGGSFIVRADTDGDGNHDYATQNCEEEIDVDTPSGGGDGYEPDNTYQQANIMDADGSAYMHSLYPAGDEDWMKFYANNGHFHTIETSNLSPGCDTYIYLYSTNGISLLRQNDDGGVGLASRIEWFCPSSGMYYIRVRHFSSSGIGSYEISITCPLCP